MIWFGFPQHEHFIYGGFQYLLFAQIHAKVFLDRVAGSILTGYLLDSNEITFLHLLVFVAKPIRAAVGIDRAIMK